MLGLALTAVLAAAVVLSALATAPVAQAQVPDEDEADLLPLPGPLISTASPVVPIHQGTGTQNQAANLTAVNRDMRVLLDEMTLVQVLWEKTGYAHTVCAGNGLRNMRPSSAGSIVLIPNAGDLDAGGSIVAIKLDPAGQITFVPRYFGQRIVMPIALGDKQQGEEVVSLTLDEGMQLMAAGQLVWTANNQGPFGNGHGLPGHIAACDPQFDSSRFDEDGELL
jgi:hypothetical protein